MRRLLLPILLAALAAAALVASFGAGGGEEAGRRYEIEVDNAFGLTDGADVKLAGVRAGKVEGFFLDHRTRRAVVGMRLTQAGFEELHRDAFCRIRPQSLIGEYYIDCQPGTQGAPLPEGARLPVTRSSGAIGLDLLNEIYRRPYNERLRILIGELGAGVVTRGPDIKEALQRALPALGSTNRVLAQLTAERDRLASIAEQGDRALDDLARRRRDVARFVDAAGEAADASADQEQALGEQFDRLPGFLRELAPSMRSLGRASDSGATSLTELSASAPGLQTLFRRLGTVAEASTPAIKALGEASKVGSKAAKDAAPALTELAKATVQVPELAGNARAVLEHLDSQEKAVEPDTRSPGGKGFSGFQAILRYFYNQSLAQNVYDGKSFLLKANLLDPGVCGTYADPATARANPKCSAGLGPSQPGVTTPDPTASATTRARAVPSAPTAATRRSSVTSASPELTPVPTSRQTSSPRMPSSTTGSSSAPPGPPSSPAAVSDLLDFLLGS